MRNSSRWVEVMVWPLTAVLTFLALQLIGSFVVQTVDFLSYGHDKAGIHSAASWALAVSSLLTIAAMVVLRHHFTVHHLLMPVRKIANGLTAVTAAIAAFVGATILNEILESRFGMELPPEYQQMFTDTVHHPVGILAVVLLGPVCEELVFRGGVMRPMIERGANPWTAIATSALLFGVFHGNMVQFVYATLCGCVLGVIYYRTGSLTLTSLCHIVNNCATVVAMRLMPDGEEMRFEQLIGHPMMGVAVMATLVVSALLLMLLWRNTTDRFVRQDRSA